MYARIQVESARGVIADIVCSLENLPGVMDDRDEWREKAAWHDDDEEVFSTPQVSSTRDAD